MRRRRLLAAVGTGVLGGCSSLRTADVRAGLRWCCGYSPIAVDTTTVQQSVATRRTEWHDDERADCVDVRPVSAATVRDIQRLVRQTDPAEWPDRSVTPPTDLGRHHVEVTVGGRTHEAQLRAFEELPPPVEELVDRIDEVRDTLWGGLGCRPD